MNDSKFSSGFLLGLLIGGGAVFLFGTRTGRNLVKIMSERGMDGIAELLEEYNFEDLDEMEDEGELPADEAQTHSDETNHQTAEKKETSPKKHFFKRIRK
jgi:polyhydroxyalkanoate synthesis regulator phasin